MISEDGERADRLTHGAGSGTGIYFHIPFCQTRCNYCHFVTRPWQAATAKRYAQAVVEEVRQYFCSHAEPMAIDTIYFGGGTPSIVPPDQIQSLIDTLCRSTTKAEDCEISLEANPGSVSMEKGGLYRQMGINRISLGAQTFDDRALSAIGRDHTGNDVSESMRLLRRCGIENLNLDLMLGLPGQDAGSWRLDLERLAALEPSHVSVYMLDLDEKSPLFHEIGRGASRVPEDDLVSDLYLSTLEFLSAHEYEQYEISNFARPGFASRHNLKYWRCEPVLGFGVGSHSFDGRSRYANLASMARYLDAVEGRQTPVDWRQPLEECRALEEKLFLGLRLNQGIDWSQLEGGYSPELLSRHLAVLRDLAGSGLVEWDEPIVRLTRKGILLSNEVFQKLI